MKYCYYKKYFERKMKMFNFPDFIIIFKIYHAHTEGQKNKDYKISARCFTAHAHKKRKSANTFKVFLESMFK